MGFIEQMNKYKKICDNFHKVNLNDFYPHLLHIMDPNVMNKLVLKGDMDVTFAGIVDIGEFNCAEEELCIWIRFSLIVFDEEKKFSHTPQ